MNTQNKSEEWKDIEGYKGHYQVSNRGHVRSTTRMVGNRQHKGKILKQFINKFGYAHVSIVKDRVSKTVYIHRLVAKAFVPNPENKPQTNHMDLNKVNNNVVNLEWCTQLENTQHARKNKLHYCPPTGENNYCSKLTNDQAREIRKVRQEQGLSYMKLSKIYGISAPAIEKLVKRITWKYV